MYDVFDTNQLLCATQSPDYSSLASEDLIEGDDDGAPPDQGQKREADCVDQVDSFVPFLVAQFHPANH